MRIKHPEIGDCRDRRAFLLFPKTIDNETRWLEWASWAQKRVESFNGYWVDHEWRDEYWIEPQNEEVD